MVDSPSERKVAAAGVASLALAQVAYALAAGPLITLCFGGDGSRFWLARWLRGLVFGGAFAAVGLAFAAIALVGAAGLAAGRPWGWAVALGLALASIPAGCAPVALVVVVLLLRPGVRPRPAAG